MKIYRARRNFKGSRGWIYEGTLLMRESPELLPEIFTNNLKYPDRYPGASSDWTDLWEEISLFEMYHKEVKVQATKEVLEEHKEILKKLSDKEE